MDASYIIDWLALIARWAHIVTGAAWIGTSFYFNWLNNNVRAPEKPREGVGGELWSIHGGHFYRVEKFTVAPPKLPETLHWFKWEAYFTWISGFTLLTLVYYLSPEYLIDPRVRPLALWQAHAIGMGTLLGGWVIYHFLCKSPLGPMKVPFAVVGFLLATAIAFGLTETLGSRAAYIHVGALLGTLMAGNVFFVIIPNQKKAVKSMVDGKDPDPNLGIAASLRSLHNNYMTLPVLYIMVSNHYPFTFGHEWNWAVLAALCIIGAGVRHWFNLRGQGHRNVWILPAATVAIIALALVSRPKSYADHRPVAFEEVRTIVEQRCIGCHSATPTLKLPGTQDLMFGTAPQGIMLDSPDQITAFAARINTAVVVSRTMPFGDLTGMLDEEREAIGAWYYQGAPGPVTETEPAPAAPAAP